MKTNEMNGNALLAAVKVGKRNLPNYNAACDEIDRRVTNRNAKGMLPTPPVVEALAILAKRGIDHVASTVEPTEAIVKAAKAGVGEPSRPAPEADVTDGLAPKARKAKVLTPEQKARRKANDAAKAAAAILAEANGGEGFVRFLCRERKARGL